MDKLMLLLGEVLLEFCPIFVIVWRVLPGVACIMIEAGIVNKIVHVGEDMFIILSLRRDDNSGIPLYI